MGSRLVHYSDVENAYDHPERIGRLAGTIAALDDESTVVCGTGDNTAPGVLSLVTDGRQALPFFDAVEPTFETFGNHDFDHGLSATRSIVTDSPQTWLTANVYDPTGARVFAEETAPWALEAVDGTRVGFVGVTDPKTGAYNETTREFSFLDPVPVVAEASERLRRRGADIVVVLSHLGGADEALAAETDVDVILGGHVHSEMVERIDGTVLTRPGVNGRVVYEVALDGEPEVTRHAVADGPLDEDLAAAMTERHAAAGLDEVVGYVDRPVERTQSTVFRGESRVGNFVADAYRWAADADLGLQNSGGIREGPPLEGEITMGDLISVVPFEDRVAVAELTAAELRDVVHQCRCANLSFGEADWWNGHVSGMAVVWDRDDRGLVDLTVDGEPVRDGDTYTLATTSFLFGTETEFPAFDESHLVEELGVQYEVLADYADEYGIDPAIEDRIVYR